MNSISPCNFTSSWEAKNFFYLNNFFADIVRYDVICTYLLIFSPYLCDRGRCQYQYYLDCTRWFPLTKVCKRANYYTTSVYPPLGTVNSYPIIGTERVSRACVKIACVGVDVIHSEREPDVISRVVIFRLTTIGFGKKTYQFQNNF